MQSSPATSSMTCPTAPFSSHTGLQQAQSQLRSSGLTIASSWDACPSNIHMYPLLLTLITFVLKCHLIREVFFDYPIQKATQSSHNAC